jgi:hypothetical protein
MIHASVSGEVYYNEVTSNEKGIGRPLVTRYFLIIDCVRADGDDPA